MTKEFGALQEVIMLVKILAMAVIFSVDTIIVGVGHHGEDVGINIMLKWNYGQNINQCNC